MNREYGNIFELYRDNGRENGNYCIVIGHMLGLWLGMRENII